MNSWGGAVSAIGTRLLAGVAGVGLVVALAALGCGEASDPSAIGGNGGAAGAGGSSGVGGLSNTGVGGTVEQPPASAPACPTDGNGMPFIRVTSGGGLLRSGQHRIGVVGQGFGLPPGVTELPGGATSAERVGWLQVALLSGDANATDAGDAGRDDAGPHDAGLYGDLPRRFILGPREVGELPVSIGDTLDLTIEFEYILNLRQGHDRIVVQKGDSVLLFHQVSSLYMFGTFSGFTLALGAAECAMPFPMSPPYPMGRPRCADVYGHALEVTVPGGATLTLASGQAQMIGDYRVQGDTSTVTRVPSGIAGDTRCADVNDGPTRVTAVLRAGGP